MGKRFMATDIFESDFVRELEPNYKLLWLFICLNCDHAGVWKNELRNKDSFTRTLLGNKDINCKKALELFNADEQRIYPFDSGKKWFIPSFVKFQYGKLKEINRAHLSVINKLEEYGIEYDQSTNKVHIRGLQAPKEKEQDKEQYKDTDKEEEFLLAAEVVKELEAKSDKIPYTRWDESTFRQEVNGFIGEYPQKMIDDFFGYWSEKSPTGRMRFQLEKTWHTSRRLATWRDRENVTGSKRIGPGNRSNYFNNNNAAGVFKPTEQEKF